MKIKELEVNNTFDITLLVTNVTGAKTSTEKDYCVVSLSDGEETIKANKWNCSKEQADEKGLVQGVLIDISIKVTEYQGKITYGFDKYAINTEEDYTEYILKPPVPVNEMLNYFDEIVHSLNDDTLIAMSLSILEDNAEKLKSWAAAKSIHHNMYGGLLYHMYRMTKLMESAFELYSLNRDLEVI